MEFKGEADGQITSLAFGYCHSAYGSNIVKLFGKYSGFGFTKGQNEINEKSIDEGLKEEVNEASVAKDDKK